MTKKDYIALAAALACAKPILASDADAADNAIFTFKHNQWLHDVMAIMNACRAGNAKFNRNIFADACGVPNVMDP